jgi:hypothetical protein
MKKNSRENSHSGITNLPILPGTLVLCGCTMLLFIGIMIAVYSSGMSPLPDFLEGILGKGDDVQEDDGFASDFLASLSGNAPELDQADEKLLDLSPEALLDVLLRSAPAGNYYHQMNVLHTDGIAFHTTHVTYIVSEGRVYIRTQSTSGTDREIICLPDRVCISEAGSSRVIQRTEADTFTPEGEAGIPSFTHMQKMLAEAQEGKYLLTTEISEDSPCIRVQFTDAITGVTEVYDVLPDLGIVFGASSTLEGRAVTYYQMTTVSLLTDLTGLDESIFEIATP